MDGQVIVVPSSLAVGKAQMVVVIFPCAVPQVDLITFELSISRQHGSGRKPPSPSWRSVVPSKPIGANAIQAQFPEILYAGELRVSVQVLRESFTECPKFSLTVLSPLETIAEAASSSSLRSGCSKSCGEPLMACVATYLLHNHEKDSCNLAHLDRVVSGLLQSQPSHCSDWNLSSVIFGKYGIDESLLHLLVRCKLESSVGILLENCKGRGNVLQQKDYKGRTPAEIARKKGSKRMAEMITSAIVNTTESSEHKDNLSRSKSKSLDHKLNVVGTTYEKEEWQVSSSRVETMKGSRRKFFKNYERKEVVISGPVPQPPPDGSQEVGPQSPKYYTKAPPIQPGQTGPICGSSETMAELTSKCLYSTSVLVNHPWTDPPFGNTASLNRGDIFYVMKELGNTGMCYGVCKRFYWMLPRNSLATSDTADEEEEGHYEPTEADEEGRSDTEAESDSDGYEEVLDPVNIPIVPLPPRDKHSVMMTPPQMRAPIKTPSIREIPTPHRQLQSVDFSRPKMPLPSNQDQSPIPTVPSHHNVPAVPKSKPVPHLPPKQIDVLSPPPALQDQRGPNLFTTRQKIALHRNKSLPMPPHRERTPPPTMPAPPPPPEDEDDDRPPTHPSIAIAAMLKQNGPMVPLKTKKLPTPPLLQESERSPSPLEERVRYTHDQYRKEGSDTPPLRKKRLIISPVVQEPKDTMPPQPAITQARVIGASLDRKQRGPAPPVRTSAQPKSKVLPLLPTRPAQKEAEAELSPSDEDEYDDASTMTQTEPQDQPRNPSWNDQRQKSPSPANYDEPDDEYIDARTDLYYDEDEPIYDDSETQNPDMFYHTLEKEQRHHLQYSQEQTRERSPDQQPEWNHSHTTERSSVQTPEWNNRQTRERMQDQQPEWSRHQVNERIPDQQLEWQPEWSGQQMKHRAPEQQQPEYRHQQTKDRAPEPEWRNQQTKDRAPEPEWRNQQTKDRAPEPEWRNQQTKDRAPEPEWRHQQTKDRAPEPEWRHQQTKDRAPEPEWRNQQTKDRAPEPEWRNQQTKDRAPEPEWRHQQTKDRAPEPEWRHQQTKDRAPEPEWRHQQTKDRAPEPEWRHQQTKDRAPEPEWRNQQTKDRAPEPEWRNQQTKDRAPEPEWRHQQTKDRAPEPEWRHQQTKDRAPEPEWRHQQTKDRAPEPEWRHQQTKDRASEPEWRHQQTKDRAPDQQPKWSLPQTKEKASNEQPEWKLRHQTKERPLDQQPQWKQTKERASNQQPEWKHQQMRERQSNQQQERNPPQPSDRPRKPPVKAPQPTATTTTNCPPPVKLKPGTNKSTHHREIAKHTTQERPTPGDDDSVSFTELRKRLAKQLNGSGTP